MLWPKRVTLKLQLGSGGLSGPLFSAFVGSPGPRAFSVTARGLTPIEPLLFQLSEAANPQGIGIPVGFGDRGRLS